MTLLRFANLGLLALALAFVGCDADSAVRTYPQDGSVGDADGGTNGARLELLSVAATNAIALVPGEVFPVYVLVRSANDEPMSDARVEFALLGPSMDSTITGLVVYSGEGGLASIFLQAGAKATSFQLRISVGSFDTYVPITVATATFGSVEATVAQAATTELQQVTFRAHANRTCALGSIAPGEPPSAMATLDGFANTRTVAIDGLVEGTSYAIVADGLATDGTTHRIECVDGATLGASLPEFDFAP